jgi:hypothetical protein
MTNPKQDRAGRYMQKVLASLSDDTAVEETVEWLLQCSELADLDLAECQTDVQKQKVWAVLVSAVHAVIRSHGGDGEASLALHNALVNVAQGRPGGQALARDGVGNTYSLEDDWARACAIALIDKYPERRKQTYADAGRVLNRSKDSLVKMRENYRAGLIGKEPLVSLVETAKEQIDEFGYQTLTEFLPP